MALMVPVRAGFDTAEGAPATTSAVGTAVTASGTIHTKGSWAELIASTSRDSFGIQVMSEGTAHASNTASSMLLDIGIGAGGSEVVLIPDLLAGYTLAAATSNAMMSYWFPIFIPSGTRIAARCQALIASDVVNVRVRLNQRPTGLAGWVGSRVTAYGIDAANSRGTNVTCGNNTYGTAAQLAASTANPIRYMQIGLQGGGDASLSDFNLMAQIGLGSTPHVLAEALVGSTDTGVESSLIIEGNRSLQNSAFNLPAGQDLRVAGMVNGTTNNVLDFAVYGVD